MALLQGKKGLIIGVANQRSIAWGIAEAAAREGAKLAFTYLNESLEKRVRPLAESVSSELLIECDVQKDDHIDACFDRIQKEWGTLDFLVHSVAFAHGEDLKKRFVETSREGFRLAMDVSAYSLVAVTDRARKLMAPESSIITLTYLGSTLVVPNYRVMGVAKAALEACVRELAADLGPDGIRINAISAGPIKTLAASGIADFRDLLAGFEARSPMHRGVTIEEVGGTALYLLSDLSRNVTGETIFVDGGFHITAA